MLIGDLGILASCITSPRAACIQSAGVEVSGINSTVAYVSRQISKRTADIDRGFAIHSQQQKIVVRGTCRSKTGYVYDCPKNDVQTVETPVPINITEERRKRRKLESWLKMEQAKLRQAYSRRDKAIKGYQSLPDE